jgi:hypothetical protein
MAYPFFGIAMPLALQLFFEKKSGHTGAYLKPGFSSGTGNRFDALVDANLLSPQRYYYLKNHLGSIRVTIDLAGEIYS